MSCATKLLSASKELHDYIRDKAGIDFDEKTGAGKQEWIKAAKDLQEHSLNTLHDVYYQLKLPGYEQPSQPVVSETVKNKLQAFKTKQKPIQSEEQQQVKPEQPEQVIEPSLTERLANVRKEVAEKAAQRAADEKRSVKTAHERATELLNKRKAERGVSTEEGKADIIPDSEIENKVAGENLAEKDNPIAEPIVKEIEQKAEKVLKETEKPTTVSDKAEAKPIESYANPKGYKSEIKIGEKYYDNRYGDSYTIEKMTPVEGGDVDVTLKYDKGKTRVESGNFLLYHIDAKQHSLSKAEPKPVFSNAAELIAEIDNKIDAATGVQNVNPKELSTDENRFQAREELDKEKVADIAANYKYADQDPIHVWKDPKDGKTYVLSGHHRLAAALEAGVDKVKIQDRSADFNEKQAIAFAKEEANQNRSNQTDIENAGVLREMKANKRSKDEVDKFLNRLGKNKIFVSDIAALNPKGKAMDALKATQKSDDKVTQKETEKIAQWIGAARRNNSRLTDAHENEMFDFLLDESASKRIKTKADFLSKVSAVASGFDFNPDMALNLARFKTKTEGEKNYDQKYAELKNEIDTRIENIKNIKERFTKTDLKDRSGKKLYVSTDAPDYAEVKKVADEKISQLNEEIKNYQKQLQEHQRLKGKYQGGAELGSLFQTELPSDEDIEQVKDIVHELINDGTTSLKKIQEIADKELGEGLDKEQKKALRELVSDAYNKATTELKKFVERTPEGQPIKNEVTTLLAKRINNFLNKIFGKSTTEPTTILKNTKAIQEKADELGANTFQNINGNTEAFYSPLEKFIESSKQGAFTVDQVLGQIKSLPQAEIEAVGLKDFLKGKEKVTKQELLDYVRDNKVNVEVVEKSDSKEATGKELLLKDKHDTAQRVKTEIQDKLKSSSPVFITGGDYKWHYKNQDGEAVEVPKEYIEKLDKAIEDINAYTDYIDEEDAMGENVNTPTKYGQYTLPGEKSNYREVLLTLPNTNERKSLGWEKTSDIAVKLKGSEDIYIVKGGDGRYNLTIDGEDVSWHDTLSEAKQAAEKRFENKTLGTVKGDFKSSHFDEPNIVAHIRLTDRTTPDGKRILFVEEAQSDWSRQGRSKGFIDAKEEAKIKRYDELESKENKSTITEAEETELKKLRADAKQLQKEGKFPYSSMQRVPDMPFKDKWQELATKKAIQIAAQEGYDGIAWINGEQTKDRYDLSKQVDYIKIEHAPENILPNTAYVDLSTTNGMINLQVDRTSGVIKEERGNGKLGVVGKQLEDVIGKDVAEKVMTAKDGTKLTEPDLKVGGKWANNLYDKQIPKLVEKYSKQFGGKVVPDMDIIETRGKTEFGTQTNKQFGLEITPDMKAKTQSLPMFMKAPNGDILGFTHNGKIYLNGEKLNPNTPVHEAGHIWTEWAKQNDSQLYDAGIDKIKDSRYLKKAQTNDFYKEEAAKLPEEQREAYFQHEALAAAIGDKGAQFITEAKRKSFVEWAKNLWGKVAEAVGFKDVTAGELQDMTLDEFSKRAATDILKGEPQKTEQKEPPQPPRENEIANPENPTTVLSFKGLQEVADEFGLNDVTSRDKKTDVQLFEDAQKTISKWVDNGMYHRNIENLVRSAENREVLTDEQRIIVQQHLANVRNAAKEAREKFGINSKEFDEALLELKRVSNAGMATRSAAGAALRVGDIQSIARYDVPDMMTAKMEALNVNELTEAQKIEIEQKSKEIEAKLKTAEEKIALYEAEIAKYKAEAALGKTYKTSTSKIKTENKTHNDFVAERQSLKEKLKKQVEEYKSAGQKLGIAADGGAESFVLTVKMAKTIGEIVKSHVEEIGNKLADVTKRTFADVKDLFEGITEKDIHDVIAGKYNEPQKTKSQLQVDLKDLQDEAKLIDKLENLDKGIPKTEKERVKRNQQIKELQDKIKAHPTTKLSQIKERNKVATDKIREKIANGEFDKEEKENFLDNLGMRKRFPKQYKEAMDAVIDKDNAKHDFEVALYRDALNKRSKGAKVFDAVKDIIGTTKALRAGIDFSALMIQNIVPIISHPIENTPNIIKSFRDFGSKNRFERSLAELHNSKYWELIQKSGLDVTEPKSAEATNKEEIFNRNLLEKDIIIKGKRYNIGKYTTAPFERAFTSLGNAIRVSSFLRVAEKLEADGYTFENNPEIFKKTAKLFNTQTGRGILPDFINKSTETVNAAFWSPRLMASRLSLLGLGDIANPLFAKRGGFYRSLGEKGQNLSYLQRRAALDMVKFIGGVVGIYGAAAFFFGADPDLDPRSTTFGDLKDLVEDKTYNLFGGFSQYVKLAAILATGQRDSEGGKVEDVSDAKGKSRADLILKFLRGKVTPVAGVGIDILDKKDYLGRPINVKEELLNLVTPLSLSNIPDDIKRDGLGKVFTNGLISMTGVNVKDNRDYEKVDRTKNLPDIIKKDFERTKDEGFLPPNVTSKIVYDGHDIKLDDKQYEVFTKMVEAEREKLVKETIKQDYYKRATDDERKSYLKSDYTDGRENAKTQFLKKNKNLTDEVIKQEQTEQKEEEKQRKERSR